MDDANDMKALKERLNALRQRKESMKQSQLASQNEDSQIESQNQSEESQANNLSQMSPQTTNPSPSVPQAPEATKPRDNSFSVFVGNLGTKIKKEQLDEHFSCCGSIKRSTIVADHYTHIPKGYALIEFESKEGLENALKLDGSLLCGNTVEVKLKKDKSIRKPFRRSSRRRFRRS